MLSRREDTERAFLALCIASPEEGARALGDSSVDEHFTSELLRRAARASARRHLAEPMDAGSVRLEDDPRAGGAAGRAGRAGRPRASRTPAMLEVQRLQLELARIDRQIQRARGQEAGEVSELASAARRSSASSTAPTERVLEETGAEAG